MRVDLSLGRCWWSAGVMLLAGSLALSSGHAAQQQAAAPEAQPQPAAAPDSAALSALVYVPGDFGAPEVTEAGGVRGLSQADAALPDVFVLAPPKLARTLSDQPTLYWYVSGPSSAPIRLTLLDFEAVSAEPLLEVKLGTVPAAGIYGASLAEHGVRLEAGHHYEWSVALEVNPEAYSGEPVAKTVMATEPGDPALLAKMADAPALARVQALAGAGYWYDALDLLGRQMAAKDPSEPWRALRASLLQQVGLQAAATFEQTGDPAR